MKKLITLFCIGIFGGLSSFASFPDSSINSSVGFESSYVFRGQEIDTDVVTVSAEVELNKTYIRVDSFWSTRSSEFDSEVDLSGGIFVDDVLLPDSFLDVGVVGYFYPDANVQLSETEYTVELYAGYGVDLGLAKTSVYLYYDIDRKALTVVGEVSNAFTLSNNVPVFDSVSIETVGQVGFIEADDTIGNNSNISLQYGFASAKSSLVGRVNNFSMSVGGRYDYTDDSDVIDLNDFSWFVNAGYSF